MIWPIKSTTSVLKTLPRILVQQKQSLLECLIGSPILIDLPKDTINFKGVFILNPHLLKRTEIKVIEVNPMFFRFLKCTKSFNAENPEEKWKVQKKKE